MAPSPAEPCTLLYQDWGLPMEVWFPALPSEVTWGSPGTAEGRLSEPAQSPTSSIYPASWRLSVLGIGVPHQLPLKKGFWSHGVGCVFPQLSPRGRL